MDAFADSIDYRWPAVFLTAALGLKLLTRSNFWANPLLRAVGGLLALAVAVCVFVTPDTIIWLNRTTDIPNISAPWVYTLLTAFSSSCLLLIIAWQRDMAQARRAVWRVTIIYAAVVIALWVLFVLADTDVERVRDFDTYYATTPYARELIVLYLLAHTAACAVTSVLIWGWLFSKEYEVRGWLLSGLILLGTSYAANLVYDALKLIAVAARWSGHNLDWLSTEAAPVAGALSAIIGGLGFLLPHLGEAAQGRWAAKAAYRRLEPLHRLLEHTDSLVGSLSPRRAGAYLALAHRDTRIRDSILKLAPHMDRALWDRAYERALRQGIGSEHAIGVAGAVTLTTALDTRASSPPQGAALDPGKVLDDIHAIADALRHPVTVETIRHQCAAGTGSTHTS